MTWPVRSRLLFQEVVATPGANVVRLSAAVPAGKTWLVKDLVFWNGSGAANSFYLYVKTGATLVVVANFLLVPASSNGSSAGRSITVPAGSFIGWSANVNALVHVTVSGAQLG